MSQKNKPTEEDLIARLDLLRDLNDGLTGMLDGELEQRERDYRLAEGIPEPTPGERTNMDLLTERESGFEQDHDRREDVQQRIEDAENATPITSIHLEQVSDAIVVRVESLHDEVGPHEIEDILNTLAEDFDIDAQEDPQNDHRREQRLELAKFVSDHVHPAYDLTKTVIKGVGFHYGNMPTLVRQAVEQAFDDRVLDFMMCTSTLLQGVNLPARNIFMRKPEKGDDRPLDAVDFWNLAGRAGRLGKEFEGNVFLVDYDEWDAKPLGEGQDAEIRSAMHDQIVGGAAALVAYISDRDVATDGNSTLENAFSRLFRDHRLGRLDQTLERLAVPEEQRDLLRKAVEDAASTIAVSDVTLAASPYLSPHRQQRLYEKLSRDLPKKGVDYYMPPHPAGDWKKTQQRLIDVYRRLQVELDGVRKSAAYKRWATLSLLWMRGEGLPDLIDYAIGRDADRVAAGRADGGKQRGSASPTIIRTVLQEVESGLRYKFVRQMTCYNSVLRQVLIETGNEKAVAHIPAIPMFLEVGASSGTMLSLIDLGLSRISARLLQTRSANYDMDADTALAWLRRQDLLSSSLPSVVVREISALMP